METKLRTDERADLRSTDIACHEKQRVRKVHVAVIAQRQRSFVQDPEEQIPEGVTGLLDFIKEDEGELHVFRVILIERFLGEKSVRFPMAKITRRRADEFGDFMTVLKLAAVDLNDSAWIAEKRLGGRLHGACLPGTRRPEEQEVSNRSAIWRKPGEISLISPNDLVDCLFLPYDEAMKFCLKILGLRSSHGGI